MDPILSTVSAFTIAKKFCSPASSYGMLDTKFETSANLKLIGKIEKNKKIHTKTLTIEDINLYTAWKRFYSCDNRTSTLNFLNTTLQNSFNIIRSLINSSEDDQCRNFINDIIKAEIGLQNLSFTYANDINFVCRLQAMLEMIKNDLSYYRKQKPDFFIETDL